MRPLQAEPLSVPLVHGHPERHAGFIFRWRPFPVARRCFAAQAAEHMLADGADMIDIGGESTRPGCAARAARRGTGARDPDRRSAAVDECAAIHRYLQACGHAGGADAGADMINDIWGLRREGAIEAVADSQCGLCVMHMLGEPQTMQTRMSLFIGTSWRRCGSFLKSGCRYADGGRDFSADRICLDPGFGFGKTEINHNYALLAASRGNAARRDALSVAGRDVAQVDARRRHRAQERASASPRASRRRCARHERGAAIMRVHDVAPTADASESMAGHR